MASVDSARAEARLRQAAGVDERRRRRRAGQAAAHSHGARRDRRPLPTFPRSRPSWTSGSNARARPRARRASSAQSVGSILAAGDSGAAGAAQADLRLFLAAETARDSLAAPALAASLFRTIVEIMPDSPYAPKAILAGRTLDPVWGESAVPSARDAVRGQPVRRLPPGRRAVRLSRAGRLAPELRRLRPRCGRISACAPARRPPRLASHPPRRRTSAAARARAVRAAESSLSRTVFGRRFQNPLLLAAGTAGFGRELDGVVDLDRLGGLVTKAVSREPRAGNPPPRVAEFRGGHAQLGGARESRA